ncbi:DUF1794 domain-containing protein [Pseudactinotalea sp. HY160]|uniref:FABP family protein n=1 Tax=Pseudactinotalea sp. HY160 TaxID=2654490 RepID=UPI00128BD0C0|nr:FABP family protein [Pseudactinotalea sp. HY160]MPV48775.1 DUF1794 domain-containing protein [Pseudactinotalea sp. HY160]
MALHPNLSPAATLLGTWTGAGRGEYPTITSFEYTEELTFTDVGKPFLVYSQRTWSPEGAPLHMESGFVRIPAEGAVEMTLAQPTGQTELAEGRLRLDDDVLEFDLIARIMNSASAKHVQVTRRRYTVRGDTLEVDFSMAAVGQPLVHHLASVLRRG